MTDSPFIFRDSASARVLTTDLARKVAHERVAIVGLGGTGSYVLDLVAKTWVREIHLFDGDTFEQHNAFRAPGAFSTGDIAGGVSKAVFHRARYATMRRGIHAVAAHVNESNVDILGTCHTVFLCMDGGPAKGLILDTCTRNGALFIDCGMGVHRTNPGGPLMGTMRVTTCLPNQHEHGGVFIDMAGDDAPGEYERNAQMAELNALNAALAVIKWKKMRGIYNDLGRELDSMYVLDGNRLINRCEMKVSCDISS